ncbi:hypothetical protein D3C72_1648200 [compost metagenome]
MAQHQADHGQRGAEGIRQHVAQHHPSFRQAFRPGVRHVLQPQGLDGAGSHHAGDRRDLGQHDGEHRQHQVLRRAQAALQDRLESIDRQPVQLHAEQPDQQDAHPEAGHGDEQDGRRHDGRVGAPVLAPRGDHARGYGHQAGQQRGRQHDLRRDREMRQHQMRDRLAPGDGHAQVALQRMADPDHELLAHRTVQA